MDYLFGNQECSSGLESGWTVYLEHSSISPYTLYDQEKDYLHGRRDGAFAEAKRWEEEQVEEVDEEGEEEDLSMVSDASSGPPHFLEEEGYGGNDTNGCFYHHQIDAPLSRNGLNKKKNRENPRRSIAQDQSSLLDDTASSPFFNFSSKTRNQPSVEKVLEYSQGHSTTQFEVRKPYQEHYDFLQYSSPPGNQMQQHHGW